MRSEQEHWYARLSALHQGTSMNFFEGNIECVSAAARSVGIAIGVLLLILACGPDATVLPIVGQRIDRVGVSLLGPLEKDSCGPDSPSQVVRFSLL